MKKIVAILSLIVLGMVGLSAQNKSTWKEVQSVVLPKSVEIYEGVTRNGNPKAWIIIEGMNVSVSPSNAKRIKDGEKLQLELVKWKDDSGKIKYTTRQAKGSPKEGKTKDIDLKGLF